MESSCPAVIIAKKVARVLTTTDDMELLMFAKENIGAGVTAKRHLNVLRDLQSLILLLQGALLRSSLAKGGAKSPGNLSLAALEKAIAKERGAQLKSLLAEAEKRQGAKAVDLLVIGITNPDAEVAGLSQGLLTKNLQHQNGDALKALLKHDRKEVRIGAAQAIGAKKLRYGAELIGTLQDGDDEVRQAGRAALKLIAGDIDHGPERDASFDARESSIERWRNWWRTQK